MRRQLKSLFTRARDDVTHALPYNHVSLYFWSPANASNFGDHLSKVITTQVLARNNLSLDDEVGMPRRLLAVGSILHFAKDNDVIWGSGVNGKIRSDRHTFQKLDVRAVRGPLTREFLRQRGVVVPEVYGDPALLIPTIFPGRFTPTRTQDYCIVPNLHDLSHFEGQAHVVSPLSGWNTCISSILKAKLVIASSLHGLIIAEAFGIPARYLRVSETENLFKYNDYCLGTGRGEIVFARSLGEAIEMGGMPPPVFDPTPLLDAFPLDLWTSHS